MPKPEEDKPRSAKQSLNSYAKYSGLAFQMIVPLLIGVYGGRYLDEHYGDGGNTYTLIGSLIGIALALYLPLRGLLDDGKDNR